MKYLYFDNAASSFPKAPDVGQTMKDVIDGKVSNPLITSRVQNQKKVQETRHILARMFNFDFVDHVVFTSCVTTSLNMIVKGLFKSGDHIITSSMEHNALIRPLKQMESHGVTYSVANCDHHGQIILENFENLIMPNTKAIIVTHASNVTGTIFDLEKLSRICQKHNLLFIVDAAQTAGRIPIDMKSLKIDALAFTGHKYLMGPQGIGGLLIQPELALKMEPLIAGSTSRHASDEYMPDLMPDRLEAGNQNTPGIIGLYSALKFIEKETMQALLAYEKSLALYFLEHISKIPGIKHLGLSDLKNSTSIVSLKFEKCNHDFLVSELEKEHIIVKGGLHGAYLAHQTLNTFDKGLVRFSFGYTTTFDDIDYCIEKIIKIINQ